MAFRGRAFGGSSGDDTSRAKAAAGPGAEVNTARPSFSGSLLVGDVTTWVYDLAMGIGRYAGGLDDPAAISGETSTYRLARSNKVSLQIARELSTVLGQNAPVIGRY